MSLSVRRGGGQADRASSSPFRRLLVRGAGMPTAGSPGGTVMQHTSTPRTRPKARRTLLIAGLGVSVAASALTVAGAAAPATAAAKPKITKYAFSATGFGTKITATDASLQS